MENRTKFDAYSLTILKDPSFAMENEPSDSQDGAFFHILRYSDLDDDKKSFDALAEYVKIPTPEILGLVKFSNYVPQWFSSPVICKHEDKAVLMIGVEKLSEDIHPIRIPVNFSDKGIFINGNFFLLDREERETLDEEGKKFKYSVPILTFEVDGLEYCLEIKTNRKEFSWGKFQRSVAKGLEAEILEQITDIKAVEYCNIGKFLAPHFVSKTFPSNGYVIQITALEHHDTTYGGQYRVKIDASNLPGKSINFGGDIVDTSSVGVLTINETHTGYGNIEKLKADNSDLPYYLWIKAQGKKADTVPVHLITNKLFPPMMAAKNEQPYLKAPSVPQGNLEASTAVETTIDVGSTSVAIEVPVEPPTGTPKKEF